MGKVLLTTRRYNKTQRKETRPRNQRSETGRMEKKFRSINTDKRFDSAKKRVRINMEHIVKRHMLPAPKSASYFLSGNVQEIYAVIENAYRRPDKRFPHRNKRDQFVFKKKFREQLGVHGICKAPCYYLTGIFHITSNTIITAYPTV